MKINKRFLQFIAAFLILIFHVGLSMSSLEIESFIIRTGYIGVDLFFFLSAFSLADKEIYYKELIKNRFINIYGKYAIFVIIAALYKKYKIARIIKILLFVELFEKGGGAFLWFVPAIILFYIIYPPFIKWNNRYKSLIVLAVWFTVSFAIFHLLGYHNIFIFTNRIPILVLGYELKKRPVPQWFSIACLPVGYLMLYFWGYKAKLNIPFSEFYYIIGIVAVLGLCGVSAYVKDGKLWKVLGSGTLELYGLQMIFGPKIAVTVYNVIKNPVLTNIIVVVAFFAVAIVLAMGWNWLLETVGNMKKEN